MCNIYDFDWIWETECNLKNFARNFRICSAHENVVLLVDEMDWDLTCKYLIKKIFCSTESNKCIMHQCKSCPGTANLKEFLDREFTKYEDDEKFNYCQWDTTDWAITGVKNTASYIPWLYTLWDQMVASNMIHCVLVLMITTITQALCIKFKQRMFNILKLISHII